jgi:S1-C subfamily serine protease
VAQPVRGAVVIVSVFDETGHLSANGHGFFVSDDGKFIADRSVMTGGVNAVAKVADGAIYNVSGALTQTAPQNLVLLKADATHRLPFLVPSASALPDIGNEVAIVLSPIERTNPVLLEEKISGRFTDEAGEWFDVTPALSKTIAGAPVINQRGELIGVVTFRAGSNSCAIRPAAAAATLLSHVSSNMTASWQNLIAASRLTTPSSSATPARTVDTIENPTERIKAGLRARTTLSIRTQDNRGVPGRRRAASAFCSTPMGRAVAVQIIHSTGNSALDQAAVSTLSRVALRSRARVESRRADYIQTIRLVGTP